MSAMGFIKMSDRSGRGDRTRTRNTRFWRPVLYQLSYSPNTIYNIPQEFAQVKPFLVNKFKVLPACTTYVLLHSIWRGEKGWCSLELLTILLLAAAVSFDSLAIGMTYGMAKIVIPILPRIMLSAISFVTILSAMFIGDLLIINMTPKGAELFGGGILVLLGLYSLWRTYQQSDQPVELPQEPVQEVSVITVMRVFKDPLEADYDRSMTISLFESVFLGLALAFDSFAAGIGASVLNFPRLFTSGAVMAFSLVFLSLGLLLGAKIDAAVKGAFLKWIPGAIIVLIGLIKISV